MKYATVDEIIEILKLASSQGCGDYEVTCNGEYHLAKKEDVVDIHHPSKSVDLGGYSG